ECDLLSPDPADVTGRITLHLAGPDETERLVADEYLLSGGRNHRLQLGVDDRFADIHPDATEGIDHGLEAAEVDADHPVDPQPGQLLHGLDRALRTTDRVGVGDLPLVALIDRIVLVG